MKKKCKHKRRKWTGDVMVRFNSRGQQINSGLIYTCCRCEKEVTEWNGG